jgi:outer membrane protein assembly factor BamD
VLTRFITSLSILALVAITGCSTLQDDPTAGMSASEIYVEAKDALDSGDYDTAIDYYSKLEARYPYGLYAQQAQLETIYAHYRGEEPAAAVAAADRFIKLHPRHQSVDYAYYMRGLASFEQKSTFMQRFLKKDLADRDPEAARESFRYFKELLIRFPSSKYRSDAEQRMGYLKNSLAKYEVNVAVFYIKRGAYLAAANRGKYILENYPQTPSIPVALAIMVYSYRKMEMEQLANDALRVLTLNYPEHEILRKLEEPISYWEGEES